MEACGPVPVPRSTMLHLLDEAMAGPDGYKETDDYEVIGKGPALTRPGRPSALMVADTGDFEVAVSPPILPSGSRRVSTTDTCDDATVVVPLSSEGVFRSEDYFSESGDLGSIDTIPPAGR